jgi:hypothetical protein
MSPYGESVTTGFVGCNAWWDAERVGWHVGSGGRAQRRGPDARGEVSHAVRDIAHALRDIARVVRDIAHVVGDIARAVRDIAHAVRDIAHEVENSPNPDRGERGGKFSDGPISHAWRAMSDERRGRVPREVFAFPRRTTQDFRLPTAEPRPFSPFPLFTFSPSRTHTRLPAQIRPPNPEPSLPGH